MKLAQIAAAAAFAAAWSVATAAEPAKPLPQTVDEIQACMNRNLVDRGALRDLNVEIGDRDGKSHMLRMKLYWKPSPKGEARVNLRLVEPLALKGSSYLLLQTGMQEQVWFHLPSEPSALHVTGKNMSEPLWGTDFSYGEIKQVLGLLYRGETSREADGVVATRPTFVLATRTDPDVSGYHKVVSHIDQFSCVLLKSEFFAKGEKPLKVLEADAASILSLDEYSVVLGYTMRNLQDQTQTTVSLSDFTLLERLPERMFDPKRFFEPFD